MSGFDAIDLSALPPIDLLPVDPQAELAARIAQWKIDAPDLADRVDLESDPIRKLLEEAAYLRVLAHNASNHAVRAALLATATGTFLDHHAALIPITRNEGEGDDAFRLRIRRSHLAFSTAGPEAGYDYWTREKLPALIDLAVLTRSNEPSVPPGEVHLYVLDGTEGAASVQPVERVDVPALLDDNLVPDTDLVKGFAPPITDYDITAELTFAGGPGQAEALAAATVAVQTLADESYRIGGSISIAQITARLVVEGVTNVELIAPVADIPANGYAAPRLANLSVTVAA